jgi:imidazolonepropionase-like amidohydrolase
MRILLKGATVIDCTGNKPIDNAWVMIEGKKIAAVGPAESFCADGAREIDCSGKYIMPGLVNCHVHLAWDGLTDLRLASEKDGPGIAAFKAAKHMKESIEVGILTVRDLGVHQSGITAKKARAMGLVPGPRVVACGAAITMTKGHTWWCCVEADGPYGVREAVREQVYNGADLIKLMASGGSGEPGEVADLPEFTLEELKAAAEEAHRANITITAHATGKQAARNVVEAGFDCIEHGAPFDNWTIDEMARRGVFLVTTFTPWFIQAELGEERGLAPSLVARRKKQIQDYERFNAIAAAQRAGVRVALGTDAGSPLTFHNMLAYEMKICLKLGVFDTPMDVLIAATRTGAEVCGLGSVIGTVEQGKIADLLVLNGNPLDDLDSVHSISCVFQEGQLTVDKR